MHNPQYIMRISLISLLCLFFTPFSYAELIPTKELSHQAAFKSFKLSPDGKAVAYSETINGINILRILNLDTGEKIGINLLSNRRSWNQGSNFQWLNDERLLYSASGGYEAINRDGSKGRALGGEYGFRIGGIARNLRHTEEEVVLTWTYDILVDEGMSTGHSTYNVTRPGLARMDTKTSSVSLLERNPGQIRRWLITAKGEAKVAQEMNDTIYRVVHRESEELGWKPLPGMDWDDPQVRPLGYGEDNTILYISRLNEYGRWAVYPYDLTTYEFGAVILEDKNYDIIPQDDLPAHTGLIYTPDGTRLLGIKHTTAYPRTYWLDQGLGQVQVGLDQALKGKVNSIVSMSDDLQKLIILSWSDRDPGTYYFFDREKQALSVLMKSTPWIKEEQMAKMRPLKFKARDGVTIHGYMSLPVGKKPKNLPLVVLNNGGYWSRNTWYFDRTVQFLANRGYAVLRVNTRGTTGYGDAFKRMSYGKSEEAVADLADAVKWAVSKKLVNPNRVAIMGEGQLSGIRTLSALALNPEVYTCGIVNSPFTDWREVIHRDRYVGDALRIQRERLGDPNDPDSLLGRISPVQMVDKITAPVLVTETANWKPDHYIFMKKFVKALDKSGSEVEFETDYDAKQGYENYGKWLEDAVAFMEQHMPEGK